MAFRRGDVVLIPFPFTDLSASKTRPAVVVSSEVYHQHRSELLLAYVSSQVAKVDPEIDCLLSNWQVAGLLKPSFVRPKIAAIEPELVVYTIGKLLPNDMAQVDSSLRRAMGLSQTVLGDIITDVNLSTQSVDLLQAAAERLITVLMAVSGEQAQGVGIDKLRRLFSAPGKQQDEVGLP